MVTRQPIQTSTLKHTEQQDCAVLSGKTLLMHSDFSNKIIFVFSEPSTEVSQNATARATKYFLREEKSIYIFHHRDFSKSAYVDRLESILQRHKDSFVLLTDTVLLVEYKLDASSTII